MRKVLLIGTLFFCCQIFAQSSKDQRLAKQYFENEEYNKAETLYKKLFNSKNGVKLFYTNYYKTLVALENYKEAESVVKKAHKVNNQDPIFLIDLGKVYELSGKEKQAEGEFDEVLKTLPPNPHRIIKIASKFVTLNEVDYAIKTYNRGKEVMNDPSLFNRDIARIYAMKGDKQNMINSYLEELFHNPHQLKYVENVLQQSLTEEGDFDLLEATLLRQVQRDKQNVNYQELLTWLYTHTGDYESAYIQARSIDMNLNEDGRRVLNLARIAKSQKEYETAIKAYQYVISKGPESPKYVTATLELINTQKEKLVTKYDYKEDQLLSIEASYEKFINEYEKGYTTAFASKELANLQAFYLDKLEEAIAVLEDVLSWPRINPELVAEIKLDLGDYYLLKSEHWESTLLYSQVEKAFKGRPLGEKAKFKNAKLSYYKGDFEWAQTQLKLLKASTDQLISNDAIDLSVFIADHLNLDTTDHPLILFSRADLYLFQHKYEKVEQELDGLLLLYPGHELSDDVSFMKGKMALKKGQMEDAIINFSNVKDSYAEGILADDALFQLAEIYEYYIKDKEKAKEAYQEIILDHLGSTYTVEARKRFRKLRGDAVN